MTAVRAAIVTNTTTAVGSTAPLDPKWRRIELVQLGFFLVKLISTTWAVSREADLGHVQSGACCAIQPSETCIAVTKVFINLNVSLCGLLKNKFKTMLESKSTPRIYPPYPVVKTRRSNYDPVLELYYYKSIRCRLRGEKTPRKKSLQESMGAWGQS